MSFKSQSTSAFEAAWSLGYLAGATNMFQTLSGYSAATMDKVLLDDAIPALDRSSDPIRRVRGTQTIHVTGRAIEMREKQSHSPKYLAVRRRDRAAKLISTIKSLQSHADGVDFFIWTQEPLSIAKQAIHFLDEAEEFSDQETEGNACEVFRQVRDTFLNGGWERYRDPTVRAGIVELLRRLAIDDVVTAEYADKCMDDILDLGLEPVVTPPLVT